MPRILILLLSLLVLPAHSALLREQPVQLQSNGGILYGTLLLPGSQQPPPVALIVAGSGPTDRNGNQPQARNDSLKRLARLLASQGIASLRYDKRGVAASLAAEPDESRLSVARYRADVIAWSHLLKQDARLGPLILIGHSEGALVASLAAQEADAQALILIAGSGRPIDQVLREQLRQRLSAAPLAYSERLLDQLLAGRSGIPVPDALRGLFRPSVQPYLVSLLREDPLAAFAATQMPALVLQGDRDIQVGVADARALASARPAVQLAIIEGMDHVLRDVGEQTDPLASYNDPSRPLSPGLQPVLLRFLIDAGMLPPSSDAPAGR
ncbi:alpha/beta hydrolase [Pseudomonas mangrovi]|uniref:Alpha/beta hydrolase n=1 Tax=Pseudomonas mangrovi TaxID=2161748 RepID=A0A2T5P6K9_9PSED|nr:alpha/beta fold hydrolase [Pseudomonas mangrovi]PTU73380.1 alpha/beta hydrolase [Pseudomonas mangrovi]